MTPSERAQLAATLAAIAATKSQHQQEQAERRLAEQLAADPSAPLGKERKQLEAVRRRLRRADAAARRGVEELERQRAKEAGRASGEAGRASKEVRRRQKYRRSRAENQDGLISRAWAYNKNISRRVRRIGTLVGYSFILMLLLMMWTCSSRACSIMKHNDPSKFRGTSEKSSPKAQRPGKTSKKSPKSSKDTKD